MCVHIDTCIYRYACIYSRNITFAFLKVLFGFLKQTWQVDHHPIPWKVQLFPSVFRNHKQPCECNKYQMFLYLTYYTSVWMLWKDGGVSTWATISNTSYSHFLVPLCFQDLAGRQCCSWQEDKAWNKLWNIKSGGVLYQWRRWLSCWALHWAAGGSRTPPSPRPPCDLRCCPPAHNTNLQLIPRQFVK